MKQTFLSIPAILFLTLICYGQSININVNAIGFIIINDSIYNGSGFVMLKPDNVVTCAHVIDTTKQISYKVPGKSTKFKLKVIKYDIENDLALLKSDVNICDTPLIPEEKFNILPGKHLFYLGYDILESNFQSKVMQANNAYVDAVGKFLSGKVNVDFIEFTGVGIPGYSGGPVFNDKGQIVGVMREAWFRQSVKGGPKVLINRAISIIPLIK